MSSNKNDNNLLYYLGIILLSIGLIILIITGLVIAYTTSFIMFIVMFSVLCVFIGGGILMSVNDN